MRKKVFSILLAFCMVLALLPVTAQAANVVLSPQKLTVDGKPVECEAYNIDGSNYFKLRDLAYVLSGTDSQFSVGFYELISTVRITTGEAYTPIGGELTTGVDNSSTAQVSSQAIVIDGATRSDLSVYNIGGSNFFKLRELGDALGFTVGYDQATNTVTVTSTPNSTQITTPSDFAITENTIVVGGTNQSQSSIATGYEGQAHGADVSLTEEDKERIDRNTAALLSGEMTLEEAIEEGIFTLTPATRK